MKTNYLFIAIAAGLIISSCDSPNSLNTSVTGDTIGNGHIPPADRAGIVSEGEQVPFTNATGYFVKNTHKNNEPEGLKIETQQAFDAVFGAATTMGKNGMPTKIDFSKDYVIAVVGKVVNKETEFQVDRLVKKGSEIVLTYDVKEGNDLSFTIQPCLVLTVDKGWHGEVRFEKK